MAKVRKWIVLHGRVQGVGLRFIASHKANDLGLTGWVRNNYDGTVEMQVQGSDLKLSIFLRYLQQDPYIDIQEMEMQSIEINENETRFRVTG